MRNAVMMTTILLCTLITGIVSTRMDADAAAPINGLCLTEPEFTEFNSMSLAQIRQFLISQGGFLQGRAPNANPPDFTFADVDGGPTDAAEEIYNAAQNNQVNPKVLLATLQKEMGSVRTVKTRPHNSVLQFLAGWGPTGSATAREQIREMGKQFKRDYHDRLSQCTSTLGGWNVDVPMQPGKNPGEKDASGNSITVIPEDKSVTALYQYTPWVGVAFGGGFKANETRNPQKGRGGNGLFCDVWSQFGFGRSPGAIALSPQTPTLSCGAPLPSRCVSINVSGGDISTGPYTWTNTKGVVTITGVNQQNIQLRPPQTQNVGGTAYTARWGEAACSSSFSRLFFFTRFHECDGQPTGTFLACSVSDQIPGCDPTGPCAPVEPRGSVACGEGCGGVGGTCNAPGGMCTGHVPASAIIVNQRTPAMIAAGCEPCDLHFQDGATIAVQDAAGTPVSVPVQVIFQAHQP